MPSSIEDDSVADLGAIPHTERNAKFTKRQWLTLVVFSIANFCQAVCVSLQAPFYPAEAEKKGATATEYGLVFGVFELTVFLVSPFLGMQINKVGAKRMFNFGILTTGTCSILFGLLDRIESGNWFIGLSFVIRSIEALGNSGFLCASFSIIAKEFPENVATMFASMETFFGLGLIVGPSVGGALYVLGGYILPFAVLGSCLVAAACLTFFVLPSDYDEIANNGDASHGNNQGVIRALRIPTIALSAFSILCASSSIGFLLTALEPHLRQFHLSPIMMGVMFVINGGSYAFTAPVFGVLCDKIMSPVFINHAGAIFIMVSFLFLGPVPFIPLPTIYGVCIASLVLHGCGIGAMLVSSFAIAHRQAVANGFPDNLETYGLVSGLWTSTFALGAFVGPTVAGILLDYSNMGYATLFIVVFAMVFFMVSAFFYTSKWTRRVKRRDGYMAIGGDDFEETGITSTEGYGSVDRNGSRRSPSIGYDTASNESHSSRTTPIREAIPEEEEPESPATSGSNKGMKKVSSSTQPIIHVSADREPARASLASANPLSPKSPLQIGATGLFGGVMGFSGPLPSSAAGSFRSMDVPHEIFDAEASASRPPIRNANARSGRSGRSSRKKSNESSSVQ